MGVYIRGMEMPKSCMLCPFCVEEADPTNGEMCMVTGKLMPHCNHERLADCPLVPVPPHGRLIDEREVQQLLAEMIPVASEIINSKAIIEWVAEHIPQCSTIIPANDKDINVLGKEEAET